MKKILPILDRAKELLDYDPETGVFTWLVGRKGISGPGAEAGCIRRRKHTSYRKIGIDGQEYYAHRLAWAWVYNEEPPEEIDHKNNNGLDNWADNLRVGTGSINRMNNRWKPVHKLAGVRWLRDRDKWIARVSSKTLYIGQDYFEACCARKSAENQFWATHG